MAGPTQLTPMYWAPRLVVRPHLLADHSLLPDRGAAAAELLRPGQAEQAALGEDPAEPLGGRQVGWVVGERPEEARGHVLAHQVAQVAAERGGGFTHAEVHGAHDVAILISIASLALMRPDR